MGKDRFKDLQENIEKYDDGVDISVINHFAVVDMEAPVLDNFFNEVGVVRNNIDKIIKLIEDVDYLQNSMLAPQIAFGTKERLEGKTAEIKLLGHNVRMKLKQMKRTQEIQNPTGEQKVHQRIIESQIDMMTKHFCTIMNQYYHSIIIYRERCKERIQRQFELAEIIKTDDEIEELLENGRFNMFPEIIIETERAKQKLDEMELRHQELTEIENSIRDLHEMFFDIFHLISYQGDPIRYIEDRIAATTADVTECKANIPAKKVSHCFPLKKKICLIFGFIAITIISIVYLIQKLIKFLTPI